MRVVLYAFLLCLVLAFPVEALFRPPVAYNQWSGSLFGFYLTSDSPVYSARESCGVSGGSWGVVPGSAGNFVCIRDGAVYGIRQSYRGQLRSFYRVHYTKKTYHMELVVRLGQRFGVPDVNNRETGVVGWNLTADNGHTWGLLVKLVRGSYSVVTLTPSFVGPNSNVGIISDGPPPAN